MNSTLRHCSPSGFFLNSWTLAFCSVLVAITAGPSLAKPPAKPKPCKAEGKHSKDADACCSKTTSGNICCGVTGGSCAHSGCCAPGETPFCHNGRCVACRPEGAQGEAASCCSEAASNGVCCAEDFGTCEISGCCAGEATPHCQDGICVPCLTDGAPGDEESCCSGATGPAGVCCGDVGTSCAVSGCCAAGSACDGEVCQECLVEGVASTDPAECCSGAAENGVCCGAIDDSCANSGCCAEGLCADGACILCLPEGESSADPDTCCSGEASNGLCCGEENGLCVDSGCCAAGLTCFQSHCFNCEPLGGDCTQSDCCEGACCNGVCIPTDFDPENCGGCGNTCAEGCCDGACIPPCPQGEILDPDTCACVEACRDPGFTCVSAGDCCSGACCNGICRDTLNDALNCGACGNTCTIPRFAGLEMCQNGVCGMRCTGTGSCNTPAPQIPDSFCPEGTLCAGFCSFEERSYVCCEPCSTSPLFCMASNCGGVCCCGSCVISFGVLICDESRPTTHCVP